MDYLGTISSPNRPSKYGESSHGVAAILAQVSISANSNTLIVSLPSALPANAIVAGSTIRITIIGSFTGTATATAIRVHFGTLGTTGDAIIFTASVTGAVGTSVAKIIIDITFRTVGASGTLSGFLNVVQNGNVAVGIANTSISVIAGTTTTAPNTTTANFITASILTAASGSSGTVNFATIELVK